VWVHFENFIRFTVASSLGCVEEEKFLCNRIKKTVAEEKDVTLKL